MSRNRRGLAIAIAGAALFAAGIAIGATLGSAGMQQRIPAGAPVRLLRIIGPSTVPLYAAALAFPLFLLLARRAPIRWRTLPVWTLAVLGATALSEFAFMMYLRLTEMIPAGGPAGGFIATRFFNTFPAMVGGAAIALVIEYWGRADRAAAEVAEARLDALSGQLRPHFIFNTLQTISTLAHRDANAAEAAIGRLGELLRASLRHSQARTIPLREELRLVDEYLAIVRERFGDRLVVSVETSPDVMDAAVPPFILQPLTENAVRHALDNGRETARVTVRAHRAQDTLCLEVVDNGSGAGVPGSNGVGLANTRARLEALYGAQHQLGVDCSASGATASIRIPFASA